MGPGQRTRSATTGRRLLGVAGVSAAGAFALGLAAAGTEPGAGERAAARWIVLLPGTITPALEVVMQAGTRAVVVVVAALYLLARRTGAAVAALGAGAMAWGVSMLAKEAVSRPRPEVDSLGAPVRTVVEGFGFPSSHVAIASALAVVVVLAWAAVPTGAGGVRGPRPLVVVPVAAVATVVVLLTALARVHIGAHWPSDTVGGAAVGTAAGALAVWVTGARLDRSG